MSDDETGKKVGLVGMGLAGLLGLLAKMEHCAVAGGKAAAPALHLAEDGARLGVRAAPLAGEGAAIGAGLGRQAAGIGQRATVSRVAAGGRVFEGAGLRAVPLVAEDVTKLGAPRAGSVLLEHGGDVAGLGSEVAGYAFDAATLVVDDDTRPGNGLPYAMVPVVSGRSTLVALSEGATNVDLAQAPRRSLLRPAQIHGVSGLLSAFPLLRRSSPTVIVGRGPAGEVRVPEATPTSATAIASSCAAASVVCVVVVCPDDAPEACELRVAEAWKQASSSLGAAPREAQVVKELADFEGRLLPLLAADQTTRDATIAFVHYDTQVRVVRATRVVSGNETAPFRLTSPTWASCIASTRSTPPRSGRSRPACSPRQGGSADPSRSSGW